MNMNLVGHHYPVLPGKQPPEAHGSRVQDNIGEAVIKAIQPYIDNEEFQPAAIAKVSKACTSICQWVRAMHKYHFVAKAVEPKRVRTGYSWEAGKWGEVSLGHSTS